LNFNFINLSMKE